MESRPSFETILESAKDASTLAKQLAGEIEAGADIDICATLSRELFALVHPLATVFDGLAGILLAAEERGKSERAAAADLDNVIPITEATTTPQEGSE